MVITNDPLVVEAHDPKPADDSLVQDPMPAAEQHSAEDTLAARSAGMCSPVSPPIQARRLYRLHPQRYTSPRDPIWPKTGGPMPGEN